MAPFTLFIMKLTPTLFFSPWDIKYQFSGIFFCVTICLAFVYGFYMISLAFWHEASGLFFLSFFFQSILGIGGSEDEDEV